VPRTFANAATGYMVENLGWFKFFIWCFVLAIPGMLMLFKIAPWNDVSAKPIH
jgi:PAT family beta-lactamase induction signal transducer AmpG